MSEYPILVKQFKDGHSMRIICEACEAEATITADELRNEGYYNCPKDCGAGRLTATYKYAEADPCPGCNTLGFYDERINNGCCSRPCMLQVEYAASLRPPNFAVGEEGR